MQGPGTDTGSSSRAALADAGMTGHEGAGVSQIGHDLMDTVSRCLAAKNPRLLASLQQAVREAEVDSDGSEASEAEG